MKKITKLTPEQEAMLPVWRDKWIEIGLKTGNTDWETFDKYMPVCYQKAGLVYPQKVIRVSSPMVGAFASSIANKILKERGSHTVDDAVHDVVHDVVHDAVGGAVRDAVRDVVDVAVGDVVRGVVHDVVHGVVDVAVRVAVDDVVRVAVDDAVSGAVDDVVSGVVSGAVDVAVHVAVSGAVRDGVGDAVGDVVSGVVSGVVGDVVSDAVSGVVSGAVGGGVRDAVRDAKISWHYWLGGQFWVGGWWGSPSFVSFFTDVCKLELSEDIQERATAYRKVCESVNYIWANSDFVMVCARPSKISKNTEGRLHSDTDMAIKYPDGWGLYLLNGIRFDEKLWKRIVSFKDSKDMPFDEILKIADVDQRVQAMKYGNVSEFIKHANATKVDQYTKYRLEDNAPINYYLYEFPSGDIFTETVHYLIYDDTVLLDKKIHMQGVPPFKTVPEAGAWKRSNDVFTITPEDWKNMIIGVHQN